MNFPRTKEALRIFDEQDPVLTQKIMDGNNKETMKVFAELERLAENVGIAFGEDTKDINNPETCRQCIRPGHKVPVPGQELSFVRRMVAKDQ